MERALIADALTLGRALLGAALAWLVARGRLNEAAAWLALGWLSDFMDGRIARSTDVPTRLGAFDFPADVLLGAGILVGLAAGNVLPAPLVVGVLVVCGGGYLLLRNAALGMALQAIGYAALLWRLWVRRIPAGWLPVAVAATIGVVNRRKLLDEEIPTFLRGIAAAARLRRGPSRSFGGEHPAADHEERGPREHGS